MGILDNAGDIILDAVLTDAGRERLARGDGSFIISKFSLSDDEIDYTNFDTNHPSGSDYYDVEVMKTLVLESMTNNTSVGHNKLITITRDDLLYLPVLKTNEVAGGTNGSTAKHNDGLWLIAVDEDTENVFSTDTGVLYGENSGGKDSYIRVDQGLDTSEISPAIALDPDLLETQYIIQIDNRFGKIVSAKTDENVMVANVSYIDDNNVATYYLNFGSDSEFVSKNTQTQKNVSTETIAGPRGTILKLKIQSSIELNTSDYLFTTLGAEKTYNGEDCYYIDSHIVVEGGTTGYTIEIPVRFVKKQ